MQTQRKTFRLGRRLAKQGPRPLSSNQGRVEKSVTGSTMMKNTTILSQDQLQLCKKLRLSTWNIRSMLQLGKVQLLGEEMMRLGVDICGLSEVRWDGQGHFTTLDGHTNVYSGRLTQGMSGVALWIHRKLAGALVGYEPNSDRVLVVRLKAKPRNLTLMQVYGPTTAATDEEMGRFYQDLSQAVKQVLLVMGNFNTKVGRREPSAMSSAVGLYGLGETNEAGGQLEDFCLEHQLATIRYDTRCYFNVRSKADISQLNLPHGTDN